MNIFSFIPEEKGTLSNYPRLIYKLYYRHILGKYEERGQFNGDNIDDKTTINYKYVLKILIVI